MSKKSGWHPHITQWGESPIWRAVQIQRSIAETNTLQGFITSKRSPHALH